MRYGIVLTCGLLLTIITLGCSGGGTALMPSTDPPFLPSEEISDPLANGATQSPGLGPDGLGGQPQGGGDSPPPQSYLGGGHPIEGVNCRRNNQSPYLLPESLEGDDKIDELFYPEKARDLAIAGDEKIYLGRLSGSGGHVNDGYSSNCNYNLFSFYFGDGFGEGHPGGKEVILTRDSVYTTSYKSDVSSFHGPGGSEGYRHTYSYLYHYDIELNSAYEISTYWGHEYDISPIGQIYSELFGDWEGRVYVSAFPLPDGSAGITYGVTRDHQHKPMSIQLLDEKLEVIHEANYINYYIETGEIIGFAFDTNTNSVYMSTRPGALFLRNGHLYKITQDGGLEWSSSTVFKHFSSHLPVIDDEGGIMGASNSILRRIEPDGISGNLVNCGAQTRPVILNDGAIAVICESYLKIFDTELTEVSRFPLPSGPESGKRATHAPLVDALDNLALIIGQHLYIINREGNVIAKRRFEGDIKLIRLGPEHLFVALDYAIYRFPS